MLQATIYNHVGRRSGSTFWGHVEIEPVNGWESITEDQASWLLERLDGSQFLQYQLATTQYANTKAWALSAMLRKQFSVGDPQTAQGLFAEIRKFFEAIGIDIPPIDVVPTKYW